LEIVSFREPNIPGTHEITYDSNIDQISIKHEAKNRKGFALGAVLAAEFIQAKKGIFTMKDVLKN
ncbi:4-hydroxy-tetrahydrodipicolinate reductase, partial [Vicingaceae bacterium]|nr:4-hydroxy-tetrahydrodipicolinate reductase [Vicingaceae bacterium]